MIARGGLRWQPRLKTRPRSCRTWLKSSTNIVEKDTHFDHLQKRNDELSTLLNRQKKTL